MLLVFLNFGSTSIPLLPRRSDSYFQGTNPRRSRLSRLSSLCRSRILRNRALRPTKCNDGLRSSVLHMLGHNHDRPGTYRVQPFKLLQLRCRCCNILFCILRQLRHGSPRCAMAIPDRDQRFRNANQRRKSRHGHELDCKSPSPLLESLTNKQR